MIACPTKPVDFDENTVNVFYMTDYQSLLFEFPSRPRRRYVRGCKNTFPGSVFSLVVNVVAAAFKCHEDIELFTSFTTKSNE